MAFTLLSPFLKQGVTLAFLTLSGNIPVVMLKLRIFVSGVVITCVLSFKNLALRPSSPVALSISSDCSCFCTRSIDIKGNTNAVSGVTLLSVSVFSFSLEQFDSPVSVLYFSKTEMKKSLNESAVSSD